ncbi:MAG: copper amine oxidase N-terminal domain-containing protein [Armatimonadetes bacterium]|nr:copper amine oxidase N-terminal domain-containing protein [Armatimonadota bacterium]
MMIRSWWPALLIGAALLMPGAGYGAPPQVVVNGETIDFVDAAPVIEEGRVMVPLRVVAAHLGAEDVAWQPASRSVSIVHQGQTVRLEVGRPWATVGRTAIPLDVPPVLRDGRVLVPLRFVGETLGARVTWRAESRTVVILTPEQGAVAGAREEPGTTPERLAEERAEQVRERLRALPTR